LILVGHQPDLSNTISKLLGYDNFNIPFKPASFVKISFNGKPAPGKGILEILIPPVVK
jgi:phosphohistidine phosphatase SixA